MISVYQILDSVLLSQFMSNVYLRVIIRVYHLIVILYPVIWTEEVRLVYRTINRRSSDSIKAAA